MAREGILTKMVQGFQQGAKDFQYVQNIGGSFNASTPLTTGLPTSQAFFFGNDGHDYAFTWGKDNNPSQEAYLRCPPLAAVLNKKAQAYLNGRTRLVNTQGKEVTTGNAAAIMKLLRDPNPLQTWKLFEAQQYLYMQMYGYCLTIPIYPIGYGKDNNLLEASMLWNIPPFMLNIKETNKLFYQTDLKGIIESITLDYKGVKTVLDVNSVRIFRDFTPGFGSMVIPTSRLQPLTMPINNIIAVYESRNELINYAGSQGIISADGGDAGGPMKLTDTDRDQLQLDFKRQYGIRKGQFRYMISNAAIKWSQIGRPTKDLMLFEEVTDDIARICDALNFPSQLINSVTGPSVSNTAEYKAQLYQDAVIPESMDIYEQWNEFLHLEELNLRLEKDFSHIPVLQSNAAEEGRANLYLNQSLQIQWNADQITFNEWRAANGMDTVAGRDLYRSEMIAQGLISGGAVPPSGANDPTNQNQNDPANNSQ
jgi:hypothetical protein